MKGLLYKDFASTKRETCICALMCVIFLAFAVVTGSQSVLAPTIGIMIAFGAMSPTYSLQYDKTSGWNRFISASPISRNKVILSKYVFGLVDAAVFTLLTMLANVLTGNELSYLWLSAVLLLILALQAIMLPVCLKLGQNAVAVIFMLLVFVPIGIGAVLYKTGIIGKAFLDYISAAADAASPVLLFGMLAVAAALLYVISYLLSCRFFQKQEF